MDDEIKTKLLSYLENIDIFCGEQLPDLFQQILTYGLCKHIACVILFSIIVAIGACLIKKLMKKENEEKWLMYGWIPVLIVILLSLFMVMDAISIVQILVAPKVYLLDYIRK